MKNDRHGKPRKRYVLLLIVFISLFCLSAYKVTTQLLTERQEMQAFDDLIQQVNANRQARQSRATSKPAADESVAPDVENMPEPANTDAGLTTDETQKVIASEAEHTPAPATEAPLRESVEPQTSDMPVPTVTEVPPMLAEYEPLYQRNHDLWGWIMIEGTTVNYPVMYTPRQWDYYLHKAFDRTYAFSGVPFMEGNCYYGCGNYLIYGHHMKNGTMFADIVNYASEEYWQAHPLIYFDTLYETGTYEVIAAFYSRMFDASETDVFRYYRYTDLSDPDVFNEYITQVQLAAVYDTGLSASYGDQLLTLSTCEYSAQDNRFVVVARRID